MRILLILTISILITACQSSPNKREISQIVGQVISECPQATDICKLLPIDPDKNMRIGEVEIIDPDTAKVIWQWEWGQQLRQKYELTVLYEQESWQITQAVLIEQVRRVEEIVDIPPEVEVRFDSNLLTEAAYVVQFGSNGKQLIVKEINGINEKSESEEVVLKTITADPTDWVVVRGKLSERQVKGDVTRLVRDYFANYQAGNFAGLSELAPDAANYHYQAEFYLTDFEVTLPENIKIESNGAEPKRAEIEGSPITEPFSLLAQVPVKITYSLFGIEFSQDETLPLTWSDSRWTMPFWGFSRAVALDESVNLNANTITLDGVATTHEATLIALTVTRHLPTTISIEGYQQQDELLLFKLPRAYKWIKQLPKPDQNELMITIESVPAAPKVIAVNLNNQLDNPKPISGVQGRVEWGPTCGNPSNPSSDACGNIPYQATLTVTEPSGLIVSQTVSGADGLYRIQLPPGEYILIPESNEFMPTNPIPFTVKAGELTYIPIIYPSMIP